jgi:hypothetical protein
MAKKSPAKIKKEAAGIKRAAADRREEKKLNKLNLLSQSPGANGDVGHEYYASVDQAWVDIGLGAPARRALINEGLFELSDLRKTSLSALKELHGIGSNAIRILTTEMKKADLSFRK